MVPQGLKDALAKESGGRIFTVTEYVELLRKQELSRNDFPVVDRAADIVLSDPETHEQVAVLGVYREMILKGNSVPDQYDFWEEKCWICVTDPLIQDRYLRLFLSNRGYYFSAVMGRSVALREPMMVCMKSHVMDSIDREIKKLIGCNRPDYPFD